ncbi:GFA family protein [Echinimonas agarilytica]|uniref:GFA family protein n=1 Tax=Echinimonas agarilytica TaxID=1215918 RepID=A0AA42B818_9GAMM|nr:GFA family protein [Echinimonas agarilytica]
MAEYQGSCHCGDVTFKFVGELITKGLRCNCSLCARKGAVMTTYALAPSALQIKGKTEALATYTFGSEIAKHHFCKRCGIYTFHQTRSKPGQYRVNLGCVDGVDSSRIPFDIFDGASLP